MCVCVCVCVCSCIVELKSKTITEKMLQGMVGICDKELKNKIGQPQVLLSPSAHHHSQSCCLLHRLPEAVDFSSKNNCFR